MDGNCALGGVFLTGLDADLGANPLDTGRLGQLMIGSYSLSRDVLSTFARGYNGFYYDYSNISSLYQGSAGTTPVAVVTDPVGLSLDSRLGLAASTKGVYLSGVGTYLSSPDSVASSITGDIDIDVYGYLNNWNAPASWQTIAAKDLGLTTQSSYGFIVSQTTGKLLLSVSPDGTQANMRNATSTVAPTVTNGSNLWIRVTRSASTGDVKFYTSTDGISWSQLGTTVTTSPCAIYDSTTQLTVGARSDGAGTTQVTGKISKVRIYNGIRESGGTLAVNYNGTDYVTGSTLTSSTTGEVWTLNGAAYIAPDGNHAIQATAAARPTWQVDAQGFYYLSFLGTDDSLTSATGGGGSAGLLYCRVIQPTGGAGTLRTLWADNGTNTGYKIQLDVNNKLSFSAGNGTAFTTLVSTAAINVGDKPLITVRDNGTLLSVQINSTTPQTVARPVVVAGTAGYTLGKDNGAASSYDITNQYSGAYFKDTGLTDAQVASVQSWVRSKAGL